MSERTVFLMRGLPSCGKSYTAKQLTRGEGVALETDEYFYTQVGDDPQHYDFNSQLLQKARDWNFARYQKAIASGVSPIVVDRGNGLNTETQRYVRLAVENDYRVEIKEPDSEWWQEIRVLLKYKSYTQPILDKWAEKLATISAKEHRVSAPLIRQWMEGWRWNLTVEEILNFRIENDRS